MKNIFIASIFVVALVLGGCIPQQVQNNNQQTGQQVSSKDDLIVVTEPKPNQVVTSPLTVRGQARGQWYFEASFPLEIEDMDGNGAPQSYAQAQGDWMTEDYVPFEGTLNFDFQNATSGVIIFKKDNPSGLPEHDNELRIPVRFAQ